MVYLNFKSFDGYIDAMQKAVNHLKIMKKKNGEPLSNFNFRNIRFRSFDLGEVGIEIELVKDVINLGLNENSSEHSKILRILNI